MVRKETHPLKVTPLGKALGGALVTVAALGALKWGLSPHESAEATITPHKGEAITHVIERGVGKAAIEGVGDEQLADAVAREATTVEGYAPNYFNPTDKIRVDVSQNNFQHLFGGQVSVHVTNPNLDSKPGR